MDAAVVGNPAAPGVWLGILEIPKSRNPSDAVGSAGGDTRHGSPRVWHFTVFPATADLQSLLHWCCFFSSQDCDTLKG